MVAQMKSLSQRQDLLLVLRGKCALMLEDKNQEVFST